jgi:hypothetical protein
LSKNNNIFNDDYLKKFSSEIETIVGKITGTMPPNVEKKIETRFDQEIQASKKNTEFCLIKKIEQCAEANDSEGLMKYLSILNVFNMIKKK